MGYYSDLRIAITKRDYLSMIEKNKVNSIDCSYLLLPDNARIKEFEKDGNNCILIQLDSLKYYKEFEEIQQLEKYLDKTKNGYVFLRIGTTWDDIEYRNTAKIKALEEPFKFIKQIEKKAIKESKKQKTKYAKTKMEYSYTDKNDILEFYESNSKIHNYIKEQYNQNVQFKLFLDVDTNKTESLSVLQMRKANEDKYSEIITENIPIESALFYLGYQDEEGLLQEINENKESEEEFE